MSIDEQRESARAILADDSYDVIEKYSLLQSIGVSCRVVGSQIQVSWKHREVMQ